MIDCRGRPQHVFLLLSPVHLQLNNRGSAFANKIKCFKTEFIYLIVSIAILHLVYRAGDLVNKTAKLSKTNVVPHLQQCHVPPLDSGL